MATADPKDPAVTPDMVDRDAPASVIIRSVAPAPVDDPTLGIFVQPGRAAQTPAHRLVTVGDSLVHGFQSGAIFNTSLSWPAIVAWELGWDREFRFPRYAGFGGLPLNIEYLVRVLEDQFGTELSWWELPRALFSIRAEMDKIEDWWERGAGSRVPNLATIQHNLGIYGWDVRDALSRSYNYCQRSIAQPKDDLLFQIVEDANARAALRVLPGHLPDLGSVGAAKALADQGGIETLVVMLGANNALGTVLSLGKPKWSSSALAPSGLPAFQDLKAKAKFNVWDPDHFAVEWDELATQLLAINAENVIVATVPHVTIAPIARGVGAKIRTGSRYFPYYTRPWIEDADFDPADDPHLDERQARAIDAAIDQYNAHIVQSVRNARLAGKNWYVLEVCGMLDRLAQRRYIDDFNARPGWWRPYELPATLASLAPPVDSRFFSSDPSGRLRGGLFSLDGVHPTTVAYGLVAQEVVRIMQQAGVVFRLGNGAPRPGSVQVDFERLLAEDTLVSHPPKNLKNATSTIGSWDQRLDLLQRIFRFA